MRKKSMFVATALAVSSLVSPNVVAAKPRAKAAKQVVTGDITVGTPNCATQIHRRGNVATGSLNGITGFDFDLDTKTWGGKFRLDVTAGAEVTNLDMIIIFYAEYGGPADDVTGVVYDNTDEPGEYGIVPPGTTKALISLCQAGVSPTNEVSIGAGASFEYVARGPRFMR